MDLLELVANEAAKVGFSIWRGVLVMVAVGLLVRAIKSRFPWPNVLPLVSLGMALLLEGCAFARSGLGASWLVIFATEGIVAGGLAAYGNDVLKLVTVHLLKRVPIPSVSTGAEAIATKVWGDPKPAPAMAPEVLAVILFDAYRRSASSTTYDGKPIPTWENLTDAVRAHWTAAAKAAL